MSNIKLKQKHLRILLIRFSSIGDIILTTPVIKAIKQTNPGITLDYLTLPEYSILLRDNPYIDNLFLIKRNSFAYAVENALLLRKIKYDYIFDLHRSTRSFIFRFLLKSKHKYKLNKNYFKRFLLTTFKFRFYKKPYSVVSRYFDTVKALNVSGRGKTEIWLNKDEMKYAFSRMNKITGIKYLYSELSDKAGMIDRRKVSRKGHGNNRMISLMPFAKWKTKEWGEDRFVELGRSLRDEYGALIQIFGGKEDAVRAKNIAIAIGKKAISLAGTLSLTETAVALSLSDCLVTNDTGVMHIGSAVSIPVIAIFGSTSEELGFFPYKSQGKVLQINLKCRPCTAKGLPACPLRHFKCMNDVSVDMVFSAVKRYL
jgi:lipopolysaccharide heptosyltransferase II